jgi:predicted thioesterase
MQKPNVTMATLESRLHEVNSIKSGVKLFNANKVDFAEQEDGSFIVDVKDKSDARRLIVKFTRDGSDLAQHWCQCRIGSGGDCLCKHIVAAVLAIQGGLRESKITLGKTAVASTVVNETNTARSVGSGSLAVFATPMMIALMEQAACEVLADALDKGQTSVGTQINAEHTAASPIGAKITATAVINNVRGRVIEFTVVCYDETGEIGKGTHTRVIVDETKFMAKAKKRTVV